MDIPSERRMLGTTVLPTARELEDLAPPAYRMHGMDMIQVADLRVDYGDLQAVKDLSLTVPPGEVYGLIGPNGAGKTSTMRVLAGLLEPAFGRVRIGGIDLLEEPERAHRITGYMPDFPPVYDELRVWEFLDLFAHAHGLDPDTRRRRVADAIEVASLEDKRDALCGGLSRGMRQRLVLGKTMLHDPDLYILDEPASGLDPHARIALRDTLRRLARRDKTVLVSSHILSELSGFCTSLGIMNQGQLVVSGSIEEVVARITPHQEIVVETVGEGDVVEVAEAFDAVLRVRRHEGAYVLEFQGTSDDAADVLAALVRAGVRVKAFYEDHPDVEDLFLQVGGADSGDEAAEP